MSLHVLFFHFADKLFKLNGFHALSPTLGIDIDLSQRLRHLSVVEALKKRI